MFPRKHNQGLQKHLWNCLKILFLDKNVTKKIFSLHTLQNYFTFAAQVDLQNSMTHLTHFEVQLVPDWQIICAKKVTFVY